jgi:Ser/Thr protein kinase RdoA (MazF antagonist)
VTTQIGSERCLAVLRRFGIEADTLQPVESGSPNHSWIISAGPRRLVVKECTHDGSAAWFQFQEVTIEQLVAADFPIQALLAAPDGRRTVEHDGGRWQLRQFVAGDDFVPGNADHLDEACRVLARLHAHPVTIPPRDGPNQDLEYWLEGGDACLQELLAEAASLAPDRVRALEPVYRDVWERAHGALDSEAYRALPARLIHGEFHGNNLLYAEGRLRCLLDWDGVQVRPRIYDVARAGFFLTRVRRGAFQLNRTLTERFLRAYEVACGLTGAERAAIVPILQFYFLPTPRYLRQLAGHQPDLLHWYLGWSSDGGRAVSTEMAPIVC